MQNQGCHNRGGYIMAYTPTVWATGDTITAEKLNKMENGIAGAGSLPVYTFKQNSGQDRYCALTQAETLEVLDLIENHELFMINVKFVSEESTSAPILIEGYGQSNDNLILGYSQTNLSPQGMTGDPYYDDASELFKWNIYVD